MKTLEEHNREAVLLKSDLIRYPRKNDIACPECNEELYDSDSAILTSIPPKKNIHCGSCDYRGFRVA